MKITTKGQVTIPQRFRSKHGLLPNTEVEFLSTEGGVTIRPKRRGSDGVAERLQAARGSATARLSTDEIMRLTRDDS